MLLGCMQSASHQIHRCELRGSSCSRGASHVQLHGSSRDGEDADSPEAVALSLSASAARLMMQAYLDDFDDFCSRLGGATAVVMGDLLAFEVPPPPPPSPHTHTDTRCGQPPVMCCGLAPL